MQHLNMLQNNIYISFTLNCSQTQPLFREKGRDFCFAFIPILQRLVCCFFQVWDSFLLKRVTKFYTDFTAVELFIFYIFEISIFYSFIYFLFHDCITSLKCKIFFTFKNCGHFMKYRPKFKTQISSFKILISDQLRTHTIYCRKKISYLLLNAFEIVQAFVCITVEAYLDYRSYVSISCYWKD